MHKTIIYLFIFLTFQVAAQSFKFVSYTTKDGLSNNYVESIVQDKTGYLWVATRVGLNRFNGTEFKQYFINPNDSTSLPFNNILSLFVDNDNILWLGGYGSMIASFDNTTQIFTLHPIENTPNSHDLDISAIFSNNKNEICISTGNGVFVLRQGIFLLDSTQIPQSNVQTTIITANGTQWLASQKGIKFIKQSGESILFNTTNTPEIKSNSIKLIFKDRDNNVWFATHSGGLIKHSLTTENLQFYSSHNILIKNNISTSFCDDLNNKLFIASDGGGVSVIENNKVVKHIDISSPNSTNSVLDILIDEKNTLWMASWNTGVFSMNDKSQKLQSYSNNFSEKSISNNVKTIATLGDTLFCGTYSDGLVLLNKNNGSIRAYNTSPQSAFLKTPAYINDILAASDKTIWVASTRGLFRYKDGVLSQYLLDTSASYKSEKLMVWAVSEGSNGTIYAATAFKAYSINKQTDKATELELGIMPPYDVKLILEDSKKRIWLGVHDNLFVYMPDGLVSSMKLTQSDFPIDIFNADAIYQTHNEYMYIGIQDGYYSFFPDSLNFNQKAPEIILETFNIKSIAQIPGKSSIIKKHINQIETIKLNHNDFPISFTFSTINFNHQTAIKYAYMLEGIDSKWTTLNGKNELTFHSLQPGTYRLKLRNTNLYGTWSEQYKSVEIIIKPPFWQTWWFQITIVCILIFVFIAVFRIRVWRLRYQKRLLTKEVALQTKTLRQQNQEIVEQKKKLEQQSDVLQVKLLELHNQKEDLEALNIQLTEQTTEILATNKNLTTAIDTKNKLLSIIAHDLKNPFNVIFIAAKSLLSSFKTESNKEQKEYSEYIFSASKNIYSILSNLLDWAMSQSGLVSFTPMNINMQQFITTELESNRLFAAQKNIKLVESCNEKIICFADEQMLRIMIRNLIQNSVKFTPEGGMISINCSEEDSSIKIEIIDTGIGMDETTMKTLFEVSSVISEKGTRDEEGRGLGLLVVKEFIEKNNGTIEVKSKKNKGSNFILKLPSGKNYSENEPNTILPTEKKDIINKNPNISILLIDDNDRLREQLSKSLGDYYSVLNCNNAIDAIEIYKKNKIDLFISDIVMQDMDGITFCNYIKKELQLSTPIILITGLDDSDIQVKAYNCGADAFIKKPFEFELLLARIQNLLKQSSRTDSMTFTTSAKTQKPLDDVFIEKLKDEVEKGIPNADFSVEILADIMGISRASLFRKTRRILGISPSEYIQHARMQVAARFLQDKQIRVSEVAYMVGFSDPHYFSNCFTKHYGISPTEYKEKY